MRTISASRRETQLNNYVDFLPFTTGSSFGFISIKQTQIAVKIPSPQRSKRSIKGWFTSLRKRPKSEGASGIPAVSDDSNTKDQQKKGHGSDNFTQFRESELDEDNTKSLGNLSISRPRANEPQLAEIYRIPAVSGDSNTNDHQERRGSDNFARPRASEVDEDVSMSSSQHLISGPRASEPQLPEIYHNAKRIFDMVIRTAIGEPSETFGRLYIPELGGTDATSPGSLDALLKTVNDVNNLYDFVATNYTHLMSVNVSVPEANQLFPSYDEIITFSRIVHRLYFTYSSSTMMRHDAKETNEDGNAMFGFATSIATQSKSVKQFKMVIPLFIRNTEAGNTIFQQAKEQIPEFDKSFIDSVDNDLMRNIRPDASFGMLLRSRLTNAVSIIRVVLNQHLGALVSYKLLSEKRLERAKTAAEAENQHIMKMFLDNLVSLMESRHISDHTKLQQFSGLEMETCQGVELIPEQRYKESPMASTVKIHENTKPNLAFTLPAAAKTGGKLWPKYYKIPLFLEMKSYITGLNRLVKDASVTYGYFQDVPTSDVDTPRGSISNKIDVDMDVDELKDDINAADEPTFNQEPGLYGPQSANDDFPAGATKLDPQRATDTRSDPRKLKASLNAIGALFRQCAVYLAVLDILYAVISDCNTTLLLMLDIDILMQMNNPEVENITDLENTAEPSDPYEEGRKEKYLEKVKRYLVELMSFDETFFEFRTLFLSHLEKKSTPTDAKKLDELACRLCYAMPLVDYGSCDKSEISVDNIEHMTIFPIKVQILHWLALIDPYSKNHSEETDPGKLTMNYYETEIKEHESLFGLLRRVCIQSTCIPFRFLIFVKDSERDSNSGTLGYQQQIEFPNIQLFFLMALSICIIPADSSEPVDRSFKKEQGVTSRGYGNVAREELLKALLPKARGSRETTQSGSFSGRAPTTRGSSSFISSPANTSHSASSSKDLRSSSDMRSGTNKQSSRTVPSQQRVRFESEQLADSADNSSRILSDAQKENIDPIRVRNTNIHPLLEKQQSQYKQHFSIKNFAYPGHNLAHRYKNYTESNPLRGSMEMLRKYFTDEKTNFIRSKDPNLLKELRVGKDYRSQIYIIRKSNLLEMFPGLKEVFQQGDPNDENSGAEELALKVYNFHQLQERHEALSDLFRKGNPYITEPEEIEDIEESAMTEIRCLELIKKYNTRTEKEKINSTDIFASGYYEFARFCGGIFILMPYLKKDPVGVKELLNEYSRHSHGFSLSTSKEEQEIERVEMEKAKMLVIGRFKEAVKLVAQLESIGIDHNDLELRNFIVSNDKLFLFDFSHSLLMRPSTVNVLDGPWERLKIDPDSHAILLLNFRLLGTKGL